MKTHSVFAALLCGSAIAIAPPAAAQDASAISGSAPAAHSQAQIEQLQRQVDELQKSIAELQKAMVKTTPSWKGAPQVEDKGKGWSFKPRGRLQYDFGIVSSPDGINDPGLGFSNEVRRARLGAEGSIPGGFGYKFELDFATGDAEIADALVNYKAGDLEFTIGQHNPFQSLEELTSSLHTSFIERAAFTDAFNFERRIGASVQYSKGPLLAQAGVFTDSIADLNSAGDDNNSYGFDGRLVFAPKLGSSQLHLGASAHYRDIQDAATSVRYRQRPATHTTDVRFVDTGSLVGAEKETGYGVEAAGIFGPLHVAGEAFRQKLSRTGFADPAFFGAYVEGGYFFTGESRGYKGGKFDRVKVLKPVGEGGMGSLAFNLRWDYLDLNSKGVLGGTQNAYQASLNWKPTDYVLFGLNYAHLEYEDAAISANGDRDYGVNMIALRSQIDF